MPNSIAGQIFDVVTCQACKNDVSFQTGYLKKRVADAGQEVEVECRVCGHVGVYHALNIRQAQAQYPL